MRDAGVMMVILMLNFVRKRIMDGDAGIRMKQLGSANKTQNKKPQTRKRERRGDVLHTTLPLVCCRIAP
jgi:hypothetical protein